MKKLSSSLPMFLHTCVFVFNVIPYCVTAQNLVPNPSFEVKNNCPVNPVNMEDVQGWRSARNTTDYFHRCGVGSDTFIPTNLFGEQETFITSDSAYCGFANHDNGYTYREYLQCDLLTPLVVGQPYLVSFRVSLSEESQLAINNLGARFTNVYYNDVDSPDLPAPLYNSAHVFDTNVVSGKQTWTFISGLFVADSAYTKMMIGNFFENELTTIDTLGTENKMAYYYVDDVSVMINYVASSPVLQDHHSFSVYPTITNQAVNITFPQGSSSFNIFNAIGQSVYSSSITSYHQTADVSGFSEGIYFVHVQTHQGVQTAKFVVRR